MMAEGQKQMKEVSKVKTKSERRQLPPVGRTVAALGAHLHGEAWRLVLKPVHERTENSKYFSRCFHLHFA